MNKKTIDETVSDFVLSVHSETRMLGKTKNNGYENSSTE
jgi:hypothetical protein